MAVTKETYQAYFTILKEELVPALGCTEPIAIAYASAKAREMTETKNYVTQAAELIEAGAYDIKDFQEYFTQIDGKAGDYQCYYDQDWNEIKKTKARYHMTIKLERQPAKVLGKITMWRGNQQIYQLDILRYRQERKGNERS